jgi:alginate O-acetyltransferase complex protein AlgI
MLFNASEFLFLFLPLTLGVFLLLTRFSGARAAIAWLTLASLFFYSWWNPSYLLLILGSIAVNFSLSRLISAHTSRLSERARAALLRLGLCVNLGTLAYFKYANFFVDNINFLFHAGFNFEKVILPLAISFFTFQQIVFLVAAWRGTIKGYTLLEYALRLHSFRI